MRVRRTAPPLCSGGGSARTGARKTESPGPQPGVCVSGCSVSCARQASQGLACVNLAQDMDVVDVFVLVVEEAVAILSAQGTERWTIPPTPLSCSDLHNLDGIYT